VWRAGCGAVWGLRAHPNLCTRQSGPNRMERQQSHEPLHPFAHTPLRAARNRALSTSKRHAASRQRGRFKRLRRLLHGASSPVDRRVLHALRGMTQKAHQATGQTLPCTHSAVLHNLQHFEPHSAHAHRRGDLRLCSPAPAARPASACSPGPAAAAPSWPSTARPPCTWAASRAP
jgi:hypothetical protein